MSAAVQVTVVTPIGNMFPDLTSFKNDTPELLYSIGVGTVQKTFKVAGNPESESVTTGENETTTPDGEVAVVIISA